MSLQASRFKHLTLPQNIQQESNTVKKQLAKIDTLQQKIKNIQLELASLKKQDKSCDKVNLTEIQTTLFTLRNKINISQTHEKIIRRQKQHKTKFQIQRNKVRQLRTKELQDLEKVKQQNKRMKEQAMKEVKQMSLINNKIINDQKQNQIQRNKLKAQKIKQDKQNAKNTAVDQKLHQMLQKHNIQMERSRARLAQQTQLQQKCSTLIKYKEELQKKVQTKKQYAVKLKKIYEDIGKMKDEEIKQTINQIKTKIKDKNSKEEKIQEEELKLKMFEKYLIQAEQNNIKQLESC